jgi:hypothetical protein
VLRFSQSSFDFPTVQLCKSIETLAVAEKAASVPWRIAGNTYLTVIDTSRDLKLANAHTALYYNLRCLFSALFGFALALA